MLLAKLRNGAGAATARMALEMATRRRRRVPRPHRRARRADGRGRRRRGGLAARPARRSPARSPIRSRPGCAVARFRPPHGRARRAVVRDGRIVHPGSTTTSSPTAASPPPSSGGRERPAGPYRPPAPPGLLQCERAGRHRHVPPVHRARRHRSLRGAAAGPRASTRSSSAPSAARCAATTGCSASSPTPRSTRSPTPDVVVFPGGVGTRPLVHDERVLGWVRARPRDHHADDVGVHRITGARRGGAPRRADGDDPLVVLRPAGRARRRPHGQRVVEHLDRRIVTAAGVSAGIDMALRLVELLVDDTAAKAAQLMIEYDPQPPFDCGSRRQGRRRRDGQGGRVRRGARLTPAPTM